MKNSKLKLDAFLSDEFDRKQASSIFGGDAGIEIIIIYPPIGGGGIIPTSGSGTPIPPGGVLISSGLNIIIYTPPTSTGTTITSLPNP